MNSRKMAGGPETQGTPTVSTHGSQKLDPEKGCITQVHRWTGGRVSFPEIRPDQTKTISSTKAGLETEPWESEMTMNA